MKYHFTQKASDIRLETSWNYTPLKIIRVRFDRVARSFRNVYLSSFFKANLLQFNKLDKYRILKNYKLLGIVFLFRGLDRFKGLFSVWF